MLEIRKAIAEIYLFLWELRIKIKIMPQAEFERMVGKLTAEQKVYRQHARRKHIRLCGRRGTRCKIVI